MLPAWRLATSSLLARRSRTLLLLCAVALSAALIAAVSCAMASLTAAVEVRLDETVGRGDIRIKAAGTGGTMPASVAAQVRTWPQADAVVPRLEASTTWKFIRPHWRPLIGDQETGPYTREVISIVATALGYGIDPAGEPRIRNTRLLEGRLPAALGEIALDRPLARQLSGLNIKSSTSVPRNVVDASKALTADLGPMSAATADEAARINARFDLKLGDEIELVRLFKSNTRLKVVGIVAEPPFGGRWRAFTTLQQLQEMSSSADTISQVDVILHEGADANAIVEARRDDFAKDIIVQTAERVTSGLEKNVRSQDLGFVVATVMAFLAASFIIMTGMSTGVTERQRELSVMRCIGATRAQLAWSQVFAGAMLGLVGGVFGVPLGVGLAAFLLRFAPQDIPHELHISMFGLPIALAGAVGSGLLGAAFPAFKAARVSPLEGLGVRARPPGKAAIAALACVGAAALLLDLAIVLIPNNGQIAFWGYATVGLPAMFIGYFLLSVPALLLVAWCTEPLIRRVLRLPTSLLARTIRATPYRYGFTAGAMMSGLALMIAIWTQGHAFLNDWLGKFQFPDAFAVGLNLSEESRDRLDALPFVTGTVPITLHNVDTEAFGVRALQRYKTTFIAFDPEPFFRMTALTWIEPTDPAAQARARERISRGGAILVAREFQVAQGIKTGDMFPIKGENGQTYPMEIVGVVTSPGLEIASQFFAVGDTFTEQAMHAVFGSRRDLKEKLGTSAISMIQIGLSPDISDEEALTRIRAALLDSGLLDAGSGRKIKADITQIIRGTMLISTSIAIFAMVISSFGVANIIVAGIQARQFEFGVLRAVGSSRGLLVRLVLGEAILIALTAAILGTLLGLQGVLSTQQLDRMLFGLEFSVRPPPLPVAAGWAAVFLVTIGAATPAVLSLARRRTRELLAAR